MSKRRPVQPSNEALSSQHQKLLYEIEAFRAREGISPTLQELADRLGKSVPSVINRLRWLEKNGYVGRIEGKSRTLTVLRSAADLPEILLTPIPLLETISGTAPKHCFENIVGELLVDAAIVQNGHYFALKVAGSRLINSSFNSGDLLIVRQQPLAEHHDMVVAMLNGNTLVKQLHFRNGEVMLISEKKIGEPILVEPDDDFRIVGKLVAVRFLAAQ